MKKQTVPPRKAKPAKAAATTAPAANSTLERLENWLQRHSKTLFWSILGIATLFSLLLFDVKISEGNDDALYIEGGYNYAQDFTGYYFTANAPFYPMLLGLVIKIFGLKLILLKVLNLFFFVGSIAILFKAFENRIPFLVFIPVLIFTSINSYYLYFSSFTYTESLFDFIQALFILYFFNTYEKLKVNTELKSNYKHFLLVGLLIFLLTFTKNIAIASIGVIVLFFILERKYVYSILTVLAYLAVRLPFELIRGLIWGSNGQYTSQTQILLQKDPYDATKGTEDFSGFITRFVENTNLFVSKRFFQILGLKDESSIVTNGFLVFIVVVLLLLALRIVVKNKQKYVGFVLLYSVALLSLTCLVLQTRWDQPRFVLIVSNLLLLTLLYGWYQISRKITNIGAGIYIAPVILILFLNFSKTTKKGIENIPKLKKNLSGDIYYGYTEDWKNYLRLSEWCGQNLPEGSLVACRKAPMSFVYGSGMKFYPVYTVLEIDSATGQSNPDSLLALFERDKVTHVILASLRRNPNKVDGYVINTIHRMMIPVAKKYPDKIKLIRTEGVSEQAYLYQVNK